jgi:hypothetical protein
MIVCHMAVIYTSLMTNNVRCLFMCLLAISIYFWINVYQIFCLFLISLFYYWVIRIPIYSEYKFLIRYIVGKYFPHALCHLFHSFFFKWYWGLNSGPCTGWAGRLSLQYPHQSCFVMVFFKIGSHELFAQAGFKPPNHDPPDICLLSS